MKTFNELLVADKAQLSEQEYEFLRKHEEILYSGSTASAYFVEFSKKLKEMRDSKLYESAGFVSFGEYVEQAVNIKQRQAYKYIEVYEKFNEEFLTRNSKLGITKLLLLSSLDNEDKEVVAQEVIENNTTVEELKKIIAEKENKISQLQIDLKDTNEKKVAEANKKVDKTKKELEKALKEKESLYQQIEDLKNAPKVVDVKDNPETIAKVKELSEKLNEKDAEILKLKKKADLNGNGKLMIFKVKFESLQLQLADINKLVSEMEEEEEIKCKKALKAVMGAYL